jgi:predicted amidohydrolase
MATTYRIAGVQMDVLLGNKPHNLARIEAAVREAHRHGAHLAVFPECALPGYCFDSLDEARPHAEPVPGPSTQRLAAVCAELGMYVVVGLLESAGDLIYNACSLLGPTGVIGHYRKVHLPYLGIDRFAAHGPGPIEVYDAGGLRVGMNICYDGSFPEASRVMALAGADLIVLPTNWPPAACCFADHVINTRALENNVYYLSVNRVGEERGVRFIGQSRMCQPTGETISEANPEAEDIFYADIDPALARQKHLIRDPGKHEIDRIQDRRPELYGRLVAPVSGAVRRP